mgnify:CR=1 FL=1
MVLNIKKSILKIALLLAGLFVVMFFYRLPVNAESFEITVYITNPEGGTVSYNGISKTSGTKVYVDSGTMAPFFIEPNYGYKVGTVKYSGGSIVKSGNLYTTPAVTGNTTLYVTFEEQQSFEIYLNVGLEGSVIIEKIITSGKVNYGFDAYNEVYTDMLEAGIVDPTKVTRSALENAASVASMVLTTESLVADNPEDAAKAAAAAAAAAG